jgi:hypothetical protein
MCAAKLNRRDYFPAPPFWTALNTWAVRHDEVRFLVQGVQFVDDKVGVVQTDCLNPWFGLAKPLRRRLLHVAIGERDAVALLVQPRCQVDGERRLADAALQIGNADDHLQPIARFHAFMQAGNQA